MRLRSSAGIALALLAVPGLLVAFGFVSVVRNLRSLDQSELTVRQRVVVTQRIPMAERTLQPGEVVQDGDIRMRPWPVEKTGHDVVLSDEHVSGYVVVRKIQPGTPISASSLRARFRDGRTETTESRGHRDSPLPAERAD